MDKLAALKFLGHWVGDLHQPLHVSFEDDRGGNEIAVHGECSGKLHGAWDTCLVLKTVSEDVSTSGKTRGGSADFASPGRWPLIPWADGSTR